MSVTAALLTDGEADLVLLSGQHVVVEEVEPAGGHLLLTQPPVGREQTGEVGLAQDHPDRQLRRLQVGPDLPAGRTYSAGKWQK